VKTPVIAGSSSANTSEEEDYEIERQSSDCMRILGADSIAREEQRKNPCYGRRRVLFSVSVR
jgi:hypothetical protein